jgi:hypothetical protein
MGWRRKRQVDPVTAAQVAAAQAAQTCAELDRVRALAELRREQETAARQARQARRQERREARAARQQTRSKGTTGFYAVAAVATTVSVNTSWRFFAQVFHIDNKLERGAMFAVLEMALVACGLAMRAGVRRPDRRPGPAQILAWALCGLSAYMAIALSGLAEGVARVALGPVLALVALHLALGIEVRVGHGVSTGTWARIVRELRERALSRLGLADDARDAAARTSDRALARAARLATDHGRIPWRRARLARAVRASGATSDPQRRTALIEQTAALRNLDDLRTQTWRSPWRADEPDRSETGGAGNRRPVDSARRGNNGKGRADTGEAIRRLRDRHPEMSAVDIAKRLNTTDRTVRRHLNGSSNGPQPDTA